MLTANDIQDFTWSTDFKPFNGKETYSQQLWLNEQWIVQRIYVDRFGPGSDNPVDWGNVLVKVITDHTPIFETHLADIGRPFGDLGDRIAKLLDDHEGPEQLMDRLGREPEKYISRVVGGLHKPILLEPGRRFEIEIMGHLLIPIRVVFKGMKKVSTT